MTTKRRVFLDGNGSSKINVEGLGVYAPAIEHDHLKQKLGTETQQLKDQVNAMKVDLGIAAKTATTLKAVTAERDLLAIQVEMLKSFISQQATPNLLVLSTDYPQCLGIDSAITDAEELVIMAPVKCLADIRAKAISKFVSDTNETGQLSFPDCQWLEQWRDEWLEEAKGGE
ncbi:MAG: hypothetical protein ACRCWP_17255 [Shewanella sp.]